MRARRGILSGTWRSAALWAVLAVFLQVLAFTAASPVRAAPESGDFPFAMAAFCGTAPLGAPGDTHKAKGIPADCQFCPFCQALQGSGFVPALAGPAVPLRSAVVLYRLDHGTAQRTEKAVAGAAQPRGPPSDLPHV
jgi:hypothetical protein